MDKHEEQAVQHVRQSKSRDDETGESVAYQIPRRCSDSCDGIGNATNTESPSKGGIAKLAK